MVIKSVLNLRAIYKLQEVFSRDIGIISSGQKKELDCIMMVMYSQVWVLGVWAVQRITDLLRML